jgi:hypothetical protein
MFTAIKGVSVFWVAAVKHFIDIFEYGRTNSDAGGSDCIEMVLKDLL